MERHEVIVIGGGPAGLAAGRRLAELGLRDVVILEREAEAGGVPRHCGHGGFGWQSHHRLWTGPSYAARLRSDAEGLDLRTGSTVVAIEAGGVLTVHTRAGVDRMQASKVMICTGARETPASARLLGGRRLAGIMNTGALQQHVYLHGFIPFKKPLILGTEWVSYSAILTCREMGCRPVAMIESDAGPSAPGIAKYVARHVFGVPVLTDTQLVAIYGAGRVESVKIQRHGVVQSLACDGIIVSGQFRAENALFAQGELVLDGSAPRVNGAYSCSDAAYSAAGNVLVPLKTASACWVQGRAAAEQVVIELKTKVG